MIPEWSDEAAELFRRAEKNRLTTVDGDRTILDRSAVEKYLPHRDPFLFVHRVLRVDASGLIARYPLKSAARIFEGHFPERPVFPGVLQIEAIGQAALLMGFLQTANEKAARRTVLMTHVLGARFVRPVGATGELEIVVCTLPDDGVFLNAVGQCIYEGEICSVAGIACLVSEGE